jgi:uncharacterized membrane protein SpoIIM required for sporulation
MDLSTFLHQRRPDWKRLEDLLVRVEESGPAVLGDDAETFGRLYRRAASDLNQAQTFVSGDATVRYLNDLVARAYLAIHGKDRGRTWATIVWLLRAYPAIFRRHLRPLGLATLLCFAGILFGYLAAKFDKEMARAYLLPAEMSMIQPRGEGEEDPTPKQSTGQFTAFSSFLFTHNLHVSLVAYALGITFGIGTVWFMFYNGVLLGALMAVFIEAGQGRLFATGILPHGVLEIPAMLIAGGAGLVLAHGMLSARPWPRRQELARCGKESLLLLFGCVPLLMAAAVLEAGVARAPDWFISSGVKLGVASVVGLTFAVYLCLGGWRVATTVEAGK